MRTRLLAAMIGGMMLMALLGGVGGGAVSRAVEEEVMLPGATVVHAERVRLVHSRLRYRLAEGQTIHDLHRFLVQQGWQRARQFDPGDSAFSFTRQRPIVLGLLVEDLTVRQMVRETREVEITIVRCLRGGGRTWCGLNVL